MDDEDRSGSYLLLISFWILGAAAGLSPLICNILFRVLGLNSVEDLVLRGYTLYG
jgi:hypothetical protein